MAAQIEDGRRRVARVCRVVYGAAAAGRSLAHEVAAAARAVAARRDHRSAVEPTHGVCVSVSSQLLCRGFKFVLLSGTIAYGGARCLALSMQLEGAQSEYTPLSWMELDRGSIAQ